MKYLTAVLMTLNSLSAFGNTHFAKVDRTYLPLVNKQKAQPKVVQGQTKVIDQKANPISKRVEEAILEHREPRKDLDDEILAFE